VKEHLYGKEYLDSIDACREKLNSIEVDRMRVKPIVKITGEFWAQITEGDGNFHMFEFLEREGAQVLVEPLRHGSHTCSTRYSSTAPTVRRSTHHIAIRNGGRSTSV